jgi:hypothetical protein
VNTKPASHSSAIPSETCLWVSISTHTTTTNFGPRTAASRIYPAPA